MFIFERERDREWMEEGQREIQNPRQAPGSELAAQEPNAGLEPTDQEIMIWAKIGHLTDWSTQVPLLGFILFFLNS